MKYIFILLCSIILSACVATSVPRVGLAQNVPDANTAVFIVIDYKAKEHRLSQITKVDGQPTSCALAGCPPWVRVSPGRHTFEVMYSFNSDLVFNVEAMETKPKHIVTIQLPALPHRIVLG